MSKYFFNKGKCIGWLVDGRFVSSKDPLADAVNFLPARPEVKKNIGGEISLTEVDRTNLDFLKWIGLDVVRPTCAYNPKDKDDPLVSLMVALWQQGVEDSFKGEVHIHTKCFNLQSVGMRDYEQVAARLLRFVCPRATCRQVGTGEAFNYRQRVDGWTSMTCPTCGYSRGSYNLTSLPFMAGSPPIGTPDQIALQQSEVLRHVLTVEQAQAARLQKAQQAIERWEESKVDATVTAVVTAINPYGDEDAEHDACFTERLGLGAESHEANVKAAKQGHWKDMYDSKKAIKPVVRHLVKSLHWTSADLTEMYATAIKEVEDGRREIVGDIPEEIFMNLPDAEVTAANNLVREFYDDTVATFEPSELPAPIGERHIFDTFADMLQFFKEFKGWDTHELVQRLGLDNRWAVDVEPIRGQQ